MAVDLSPINDPLSGSLAKCIEAGVKPFSEEFVQRAREAGLVSGFDWKRRGGMHLEHSTIFE